MNETYLNPPSPFLFEATVRHALEEDLGGVGDLTTDALVAPGTKVTAHLVARAPGRIAGLGIAALAFQLLDPEVAIEVLLPDGADASQATTLARIRGEARAVLTAERTALNFLGRLSGVATVTRDLVERVRAYPAQVVCTRKTTPGLRLLEKYAVRAGGGSNHRFGLDDAVLIKDNHRLVAGGLAKAIEGVRRATGHLVKIEAEVETLEELQVALDLGVDAVLLDNMSVELLRTAVERARGRALTEASGGITPENAQAMAATGVDLLSVGWLTHSAPSLDVALDLV